MANTKIEEVLGKYGKVSKQREQWIVEGRTPEWYGLFMVYSIIVKRVDAGYEISCEVFSKRLGGDLSYLEDLREIYEECARKGPVDFKYDGQIGTFNVVAKTENEVAEGMDRLMKAIAEFNGAFVGL